MNIGTQAKNLVIKFYDLTGIKYTNSDIMKAVKNTKILLNTFTYEEIEDTINYCIKHPPEKGIYSFGYILHNISRVTAMLKASKKTEESFNKETLKNYGLENKGNKKVDTKKSQNIFDE